MATEKSQLLSCLTCGTPFGNEALAQAIEEEQEILWCSVRCKEEFYRQHFAGSVLAQNVEDEEKQKRKDYRNSAQYKRFMGRVEKVGFCRAFEEEFQ